MEDVRVSLSKHDSEEIESVIVFFLKSDIFNFTCSKSDAAWGGSEQASRFEALVISATA